MIFYAVRRYAGNICLVDSSKKLYPMKFLIYKSRGDECMLGVWLAREINSIPTPDKNASHFHQWNNYFFYFTMIKKLRIFIFLLLNYQWAGAHLRFWNGIGHRFPEIFLFNGSLFLFFFPAGHVVDERIKKPWVFLYY